MSQISNGIGVAAILKNNQYILFESGLDNEYQVELSRYTTLFKNASDIEAVIEGIKYGFVGRGEKEPQEFWKCFRQLGDMESFKRFSNNLLKIGFDQISQIILWSDEDEFSYRVYRWINYMLPSGQVSVGSAASKIKDYYAEDSAWSCIRDAIPNIKDQWEDKPKKKPANKFNRKFWTNFKNNVIALENREPRDDGFYVYDNIIYNYDNKYDRNPFNIGEEDYIIPAGIIGIKGIQEVNKYVDIFFNCPGAVYENFIITTDLQYLNPYDFFISGINNLKVIDSQTGALLFQTKAFKEASTLLCEREKFMQFCELLPTSDWEKIQALFKRKPSASAKATTAKIEISEENRIEIPFPHNYYRNMLRDDGAEEFVIEKNNNYGVVLRVYTGMASHVTIPKDVDHIFEKAFSGSLTLKKIEFSTPVSMGEGAFENCINLEEIIIDAEISTGSKNIFRGCGSVKKVTITENGGLDYAMLLSFYEDLPNTAFNYYNGGYYIGSETNPYRILLKYDDNQFVEANIPSGVEIIYLLAFRGCELLQTVVIPKGVSAIDDSTFRGCKSLREIVWPSTLTSIEARAFCECSSLETITIPQGVKKIAKEAFSSCYKLQTVTILDGAEYIGDLTFANCENLKYVVIPDSVKRIRSNSFENSPNVVIVSNNEYAERYAKKNNIAFQGLNNFKIESSLEAEEVSTIDTNSPNSKNTKKEKEEAPQPAKQESKANIAERLIAQMTQECREKSCFLSIDEICDRVDASGLSRAYFSRHISEKYGKTPHKFFEDANVIKSLEHDFNDILAVLKKRYETRTRVCEVSQLISDNADLDLSIIANNAKKFTNMTTRELLLSEGILAVEESPNQSDLFVGVLHMPGNEPENIKKRLATLFAKLEEAYPDKIISGLNKDHRKWGETVTELYRELGYKSGSNFLCAYGYTMADDKGGRPSNDANAVIEELKKRYPNGSNFTTVAMLKEKNPDIAGKIKSVENKSTQFFGMSLGKYLKQIGVLGCNSFLKPQDDSNAILSSLNQEPNSDIQALEQEEQKRNEESEFERRRRLEEAYQKSQDDERRKREAEERKAREEAERKAREEAERKAREEAERKAREEAERKAREEAERKAREEAERKAREEAKRKLEQEKENAIKGRAEFTAAEKEKIDQAYEKTVSELTAAFEAKRSELQNQLESYKKLCSSKEQELAKASFFAFIRKKNLKRDIELAHYQIKKMEDELSTLLKDHSDKLHDEEIKHKNKIDALPMRAAKKFPMPK